MDELIRLIVDTLGIDEPIRPDTPLLSSGLVDSLGAVTLLVHLEQRYGVELEPEDVDVDTFDTPEQILKRLKAVPGVAT